MNDCLLQELIEYHRRLSRPPVVRCGGNDRLPFGSEETRFHDRALELLRQIEPFVRMHLVTVNHPDPYELRIAIALKELEELQADRICNRDRGGSADLAGS